MGNVGYSAALIEMVDVEFSARKIGFDVERLEIRRAEDIEPALVGQQRGVGALYVCQDSLVVANRHFHVETLGGLEVDDQIVFRRLHDRQIGSFCAFEDAAGVDAYLAIGFREARAVTDEADWRRPARQKA